MERVAKNQPMIQITSRRRFKWRGWQTEVRIDLNVARLVWWAVFWATLWCH
jgi:hypothetical protein